jgi:hypothetical protein
VRDLARKRVLARISLTMYAGVLPLNVMEKPNGAKIIARRTARYRKIAQRMLNQSFSYRQIMRHLGYKSPASVTRLLGERKKPRNGPAIRTASK